MQRRNCWGDGYIHYLDGGNGLGVTHADEVELDTVICALYCNVKHRSIKMFKE